MNLHYYLYCLVIQIQNYLPSTVEILDASCRDKLGSIPFTKQAIINTSNKISARGH